MQESAKINQPDDEKDQQFFSDGKTQGKIDKHQTNINDKISEEDIQDVETGINTDNSSINKPTQTEKLEIDGSGDAENKKDEPNEQLPTAFNILGS